MAKQKGGMPTLWKVDHEPWRLFKLLIDADMPRKRTGAVASDTPLDHASSSRHWAG